MSAITSPPEKPARSQRFGSWVRVPVIAMLFAGLATAVWCVVVEWEVSAARQPEVCATLFATPGPAAGSLSPRLDLLRGACLAGHAADAEGHARENLLVHARTLIERSASARRNWGEPSILLAYAASIDEGVNPESSRLISQSYREAPFLSEAGDWRIRYAIAAWSSLDSRTRLHAVAEAQWFASQSRSQRIHMGVLFAGTPAAEAYRNARSAWR